MLNKYIKTFENYINDNFKEWFKNSKVVDDKGNPLVVYHGSGSLFDSFNGYSFFTNDYMNADGYASGEYVYDVYLSIQNPLIIDCMGRMYNDLKTDYGTSTIEIVSKVDTKKYDGIIFTNIKDSWIDDEEYQDTSTVYVVFEPNQIKSVDNNGSFDINNINIYEKRKTRNYF